jgi:DNA-binding LytR/AlgR family response regulator
MTQENIAVKHLAITYVVKIKDILFIESCGKKIVIHTESGPVECFGQISDYESFQRFFRCHRSYVVNMEHVIRYNANTITLSNQKEILMSRRRYAAFTAAHLEMLNTALSSHH